jgi:hypothetical protein
MNQLMTAASSLPGYDTSALPVRSTQPRSGPYLTKLESTQVSCGGNQGWTELVLEAGFAWSGSTSSLIARLNSELTADGWTVNPIPRDAISPVDSWKKRLSDGSLAEAQLTPPTDEWHFTASAPPNTADTCPPSS